MIDQNSVLIEKVIKHMITPLFRVEVVSVAENKIPSILCSENKRVFGRFYYSCPRRPKLGNVRRSLALLAPVKPVIYKSILGAGTIGRIQGAGLIRVKGRENFTRREPTPKPKFEDGLGFVGPNKTCDEFAMTKIYLNRIHLKFMRY
jgi:hypothetical protein